MTSSKDFTCADSGLFIDHLPEILKHRELKKRFSEADTFFKRMPIIREIYEIQTPLIFNRAAQGYLGHTNPYYVDWCDFMSPIEYDAWCSIRNRGIGLFPEYPALGYFIDFANPFLKVGIELDGKAFHDAVRDKVRDTKLAEAGWKIFRVPGRECYTKDRPLWQIEEDEYLDPQEKERQIHNYFMNTSDGVIEAIAIVYFYSDGRFESQYRNQALQTLNAHRLANFNIL